MGEFVKREQVSPTLAADMATAAPYWQPVLLVKVVTTLDVLSRDRAWFGMGTITWEAFVQHLPASATRPGTDFTRY